MQLFLSHSACSVGQEFYLAFQLIPCMMIFQPSPKLSSPIVPEKRIQPLRGHSLMPLSLLHDIQCLERCLLFLPDLCKAPGSPHVIPLLSLYLYSTAYIVLIAGLLLRSATFCHRSLFFCCLGSPKFHQPNLTCCFPKHLGPSGLILPLFIVPMFIVPPIQPL